MTEWAASLLENYLGLSNARTRHVLHVMGATGSALLFVLLATLIIAGEALFGARLTSSLQVGDIAAENILAPRSVTYNSDVLTQRSQREAAAAVGVVYDPPDPNVSRAQSQLARQILDFIKNVRRDLFASPEEKLSDLRQITALTLTDEQFTTILGMSVDAWQAVDDEIINVLERVMRESIRETDLNVLRNQIPTQVSIRFSALESDIIVAIVKDLVRPNTFPNATATEAARQSAVDSVEPVPRSFTLNEVVVRQNELIEDADLEALVQLGLLEPQDRRIRDFVQAFLASLLIAVMTGLYITRFERHLFQNTRFLMLLAVIFLLVLAGAQLVGLTGQIYLYPAAGLALLYVAVASQRVALVGSLNLAFLMGLMLGDSLELALFVGIGSLIGILTLRNFERLNSFFLSGLVIGLTNTVVVTVFALSTANDTRLSLLVPFSLINGLFSAAAAIAGMYIVTLLFNLPTSLRLSELGQPNQPLLQRLLREAPGTYQHSLQVANLSEQAALAIQANAEMVRVAALYHDIGKMLNAAFFSENQQFGGGNPHDVLDDPYRSADIIISHVTQGDELAREYRLPRRFRDFIREHHGTTEVFVFYRKAVNAAGGDESEVDIDAFRYPGPKPRSRETAIMMLADSSESAVRSIGPTSKAQVSEIIHNIVDDKMKSGQLDESNLTLNDIQAIKRIFVEMLQAVYHPRIDYKKATTASTTQERSAVMAATTPRSIPPVKVDAEPKAAIANEPAREMPAVTSPEEDAELLADDDTPMADVPVLPRSNENRPRANGKVDTTEQEPSRDQRTE
jgi:cyclic-di-AMP phosphodiesterase PgpH